MKNHNFILSLTLSAVVHSLVFINTQARIRPPEFSVQSGETSLQVRLESLDSPENERDEKIREEIAGPDSIEENSPVRNEILKEPVSNSAVGALTDNSRVAYLYNPAPAYPLRARFLGQEGRMIIRAYVTSDGTCGQAYIDQSTGHALLDRSGLAAVKMWKFRPAENQGELTGTWIKIPVQFRLHGS